MLRPILSASIVLLLAAFATACAKGGPELRQPVGQSLVRSSLSRSERERDSSGDGAVEPKDAEHTMCEFERLSTIEFGSGSRDLDEQQLGELQRFARCLMTVPYETSSVVLIGYTDVLGTVTANLMLGLERAETVMNQLIAAGVPPGRILIASAGELQRPHESLGLRAHRVEVLITHRGRAHPDERPIARGIDAQGLIPRPRAAAAAEPSVRAPASPPPAGVVPSSPRRGGGGASAPTPRGR